MAPGGEDDPGHWEHFSHMADVGIRGIGANLDTAFEQAAIALTAAITEPSKVRNERCISLECEADDLEGLLFEWLNTLVYEMAVEKMLFGRFEVRIDDRRLQARAWGETLDRARHHPAVEVKGATYTELRVAREAKRWIAQCVVDV